MYVSKSLRYSILPVTVAEHGLLKALYAELQALRNRHSCIPLAAPSRALAMIDFRVTYVAS